MLIEYVKPGAVVANPVEAWNLNVDECAPVDRDTNFLEKRERIGNMLKHMPEDDSISRESNRPTKRALMIPNRPHKLDRFPLLRSRVIGVA